MRANRPMLGRRMLGTWALVAGLGLALGACGVETASEGQRGQVELPRGTGGKADDALSCKASCGKKAPGGCWCDDQCEKFGDCCADKKQACDQKQPSCEGACGKKSKDGCWCDEACAKYGDCCPDKQDKCDVKPAGCASNSGCAKDEYCATKSGCAAKDNLGECKTKPLGCVKIFKPVCGCDGKTYGNSCQAHAAGTNVKSEGECKKFCGGIAAFPCPEGQKCLLDGNYPDAGGHCVPNDYCDSDADCAGMKSPLACVGSFSCKTNKCVFECDSTPPKQCYKGGCSGQLCTDQPGAVSTCEWLPWYACFQKSSCGTFGANGGCGWEKTAAFVACMKSFGKTL